jgi:hypothetical protein
MSTHRRRNSGPDDRNTESRHRVVTGEEARQGRIVLTTRVRRAAFIGGLVALVLLPLAIALLAR